MKQTLIAFLLGWFSLSGQAEEILSAMESNEFILNVQSGNIHVMSVTEIAPIEFDTQWVSEDTNVVGRLFVNGIPKREFVGFGQVDWVPPTAGVYQVSCEFYREEEKIGSSLNAAFEVDPISISFTPNTEVVPSVPFVVSMVCSDPAAVIHYTTDGSEPNSASPVYTEGVEFDRNVIVRAVGVVRDSFVGTTGSHQYVHAVPNPKITPGEGSTFALDSCEVSISVDLPNAVVYYTTNGSSPRLTETYRYKGPFVLTDSAKIRAVATFQTLKSSYVDASISKVNPVAPGTPTISPEDGFQFRGGSCKVSISAPCDGAVLYYTIDGSVPEQTGACLYTGPFVVSKSVTVKAIAVHDGIVSDCAIATLTEVVLDVQGTVGSQLVTATTGGVASWLPIWDATLSGTDATVRSGVMGSAGTDEGNVSWLELLVSGSGTLSFWWKVDCEHDDSGECTWDRATYFIDDDKTAAASIDGKKNWTHVSVPFQSTGSHKVKIVFHKDADQDPDYVGADCAWVGRVSWISNSSDPIPDLGESPTAQQIKAALEGSADAKLAERITDGETYNKYRDWASKVKMRGSPSAVGAETVKNAPNAWLSFAFDSETLIETEPSDGDLKIDKFEPGSVRGMFDFTVGVKDVDVGPGAAADNLKKVLGIVGGAVLNEMSADKVSVFFDVPFDGKVKFTAGPMDSSQSTFFMRVLMKP